MSKVFLNLDPEVRSALAGNKPIVALESTVIAHGLPQPQNLETAQQLERIVREEGSVPATIAILEGRLLAGLSDEQIRFVAKSEEIKKVSIRDLPIAIARQWNGATTVASTTWIAHRAGISVFATGGIGGVHRGSNKDISADLPALATTEWLETYGITVVGYQCDEMPAFYSRRSGLPIDVRADSPDDVAEIFRAQQELALERALLVTVPVPEEFEVPAENLERTLDAALQEAESQQISRSELTPFLLLRMAQASEGATLKANIALLENNARVAAQIAAALTE